MFMDVFFFETAKYLSPDDPNFAVSYKAIAQCEVASDADLMESFRSLLSLPGLYGPR